MFNALLKGDVDEAMENIDYMSKENKFKQSRYDEDPDFFKWTSHNGTMFGRS